MNKPIVKLTPEQIAIINSKGNIKINAVAGSGKTSTLIEYCKARPKKAKILYLAFNKSVQVEADSKFQSLGLKNVKSKTAHSLGFGYIKSLNYEVINNEYNAGDLTAFLNFPKLKDAGVSYKLANHIIKYVSYYCNTPEVQIEDLDYRNTLSNEKDRTFVASHLSTIKNLAYEFWEAMENKKIKATPNFYLKKYQLSKPRLNYDFILFDEGQDASGSMLDVFLRQKATKVIVGDTHQQIYGWRFAVNALEQVEFKSYELTKSFRFGGKIANLANRVLISKNLIKKTILPKIEGVGNSESLETRAIIARTNLGLFRKVLDFAILKKHKNIYFEGKIEGYTFAKDGTSITDVLNLSLGKYGKIRNPLIKKFKSMTDLKNYVTDSEDHQLEMIMNIVNEHGEKIPEYIKKIKKRCVKQEDRETAEIIFSTLHKSKGQEYDKVLLVEDFVQKSKLKTTLENDVARRAMAEEVNMLYVGVTRAKHRVHIPKSLVPDGIIQCEHVQIIKDKETDIKADATHVWPVDIEYQKTMKPKASGSYSIDEIREVHSNAYKPWTDRLDDELTVLWCENMSTGDLAVHFGRKEGAILSRIKKLELKEKYG